MPIGLRAKTHGLPACCGRLAETFWRSFAPNSWKKCSSIPTSEAVKEPQKQNRKNLDKIQGQEKKPERCSSLQFLSCFCPTGNCRIYAYFLSQTCQMSNWISSLPLFFCTPISQLQRKTNLGQDINKVQLPITQSFGLYIPPKG